MQGNFTTTYACKFIQLRRRKKKQEKALVTSQKIITRWLFFETFTYYVPDSSTRNCESGMFLQYFFQ